MPKDNNTKSGASQRRREAKREQAQERQATYDALSTAEKLERLATQPGQAKKQRARLGT